MAATSKGAREYVVRDANLSALRRAFDQRYGLVLQAHLDHCQYAAQMAARLAQTVAGAWVVRAVARWDAGRCRARCLELARDCP
jgi:hypothetical protein